MEERKVQQAPIILYRCSVCGYESQDKGETAQCEKRHTCKHEPRYGFARADDDAWWFNARGIYSACKHCGLRLGYADFEQVDNADDEEALAKIYSIVTATFPDRQQEDTKMASNNKEDYSMCWYCNVLGTISEPKCQQCGATNPNVDMDTSMQEVEDKTLIRKPSNENHI